MLVVMVMRILMVREWRGLCSRYNHDADVHGADMLVVMVMRVLMVTTVGMAGLVQPV